MPSIMVGGCERIGSELGGIALSKVSAPQLY